MYSRWHTDKKWKSQDLKVPKGVAGRKIADVSRVYQMEFYFIPAVFPSLSNSETYF